MEHILAGGLFTLYFGFLLVSGFVTGKMPTPVVGGTDAFRDEKRFKFWSLAALNASGMLVGLYLIVWGPYQG